MLLRQNTSTATATRIELDQNGWVSYQKDKEAKKDSMIQHFREQPEAYHVKRSGAFKQYVMLTLNPKLV